MPSVFVIAIALLTVYLVSFLFRFLRNYLDARKSNFPSFVVPWDQNAFVWMVISVPLRPWLEKNLPRRIFERIGLTIYGFEFHEGTALFGRFATSNGRESKSYVMVTPGNYEFGTRDPEIALEILKRPADFQQHPLTDRFMAKFGPNLLTTNGQVWARQRKIVASVINERISKTVFNESAVQTRGLLEEVASEGNETNRMFDMMKKITINVLSGAGLGVPVDWRNVEHDIPKHGFKMTYIEAVKTMVQGVNGPIILPQWFLTNYPSFMPGYRLLHSLGNAIDEFPTHTKQLLEEERQHLSHTGGETRSNIMSQLLRASHQGTENGDVKGRASSLLSEDELLSNLFVFTIAGFDTTANTLSYGLTLLCRYPQWQEWLFEEIDRILLTDSKADGSLEYTNVYPKAVRVLATMYETLRVYTPLVHLAKQTKTPQTITTESGKQYYFPANATVYVNLVALHMDPSLWRNLNLAKGEQERGKDELDFRPTRWIEPESADSGTEIMWQPPKGTFMPWSAGPRVCPGQKMAQVEFVTIFLTLFRSHKIEAVPLKKADDSFETQTEVEARLDRRLKDSFPVLTIQMRDVYDVEEGDEQGLRLRLVPRKTNMG